MSDFFPKRPHREPMELQLTAMIDIFSMIVIFLIMGSVFGGADIIMPSGITLPRSNSPEISASAPTLGIAGGKIKISVIENEEFPLELFKRGDANDSQMIKLRNRLKGFIDKLPEKERSAGVLLNVVTDKETPYSDLFDTVKVFREIGFNTLLFVAIAEGRRT